MADKVGANGAGIVPQKNDLHITENGLRVGSKEWIARATKDGDERLKVQYYGLSKSEWDDVQKDSGAPVVLYDLKKEAGARTISFVGQGEKDYVAEANQKKADEEAAQKSKEFWSSPVTWVAIAGAVGLVAIFYMRS